MKYLKIFGLAALATTLMVFIAAVGTASATIIESSGGSQYLSGTSITAESEGTTTFHPPIGEIECEESHFGGKTTNNGGTGVEIEGTFEAFSFSKCNATATVLFRGLWRLIKKAGSAVNGVLRAIGFEATFVFAGFHCIYKANNTEIGTITGGATATLDIEATLPRTGGSSGIFCGSTAQWTGSYSISNPSSLNVT